MSRIVRRLRGFGQEVSVGAGLVVFDTPGSPEGFEVVFGKRLIHAGSFRPNDQKIQPGEALAECAESARIRMMKVQAAVFDIGNVLLLFDYMKAAWRLMEKNQLVELPERTRIVKAKHDYESGLLNRREFLDIVRPEFRDIGPVEDFVAIWQDIFEENVPMTTLARRLAGEMPVFLISNISDIHIEFIRDRYEVFSIFRDAVYSCEACYMKPDERIFEHAIRRFGIDPRASLYFDDLADNCASAARLGFRVHHYSHEKHAEAEAWTAREVRS